MSLSKCQDQISELLHQSPLCNIIAYNRCPLLLLCAPFFLSPPLFLPLWRQYYATACCTYTDQQAGRPRQGLVTVMQHSNTYWGWPVCAQACCACAAAVMIKMLCLYSSPAVYRDAQPRDTHATRVSGARYQSIWTHAAHTIPEYLNTHDTHAPAHATRVSGAASVSGASAATRARRWSVGRCARRGRGRLAGEASTMLLK